MKKILLTAVIAAAAMNVSAVELDLDNKYVIGSAGLSSYPVGDSTFGFGIGIGAPIEGVELIDDSELFIEAGYLRLGANTYDFGFGGEVTQTFSSIYGAAKLRFEVQDDIYAYGKAGLGYVTSDVEYSGAGAFGGGSVSELKLQLGGGVQYQYSDEITVGAEYILHDGTDITSMNGVVTYNF